MIYEVVIEETVSQRFKIKAKSLGDALECAKQMYREGNIVLDSPEVHHKQIACVTDGELTEWEEF